MYWIFSLLFVIAVLIPDIIRDNFYLLSEERAEEVAIFILGVLAFLTFLRNERKIINQRKEKEKTQKKMDQAVKDLVDSYSYIGEVNRKMDILMEIALGLTDRSILDRKKENETYESIINAMCFLLRADRAMIRFVNVENNRTEKEVFLSADTLIRISNKDLTRLPENISINKIGNLLIVASHQKISDVRCYLIAENYDENETNKPKNAEILKLFSSQAIFLYFYMQKSQDGNCSNGNTPNK